MLLWLKYRLMYFKLQRIGIGNKPSYIKDTFFRKIPDINASFAPNNVHIQGWSLKFGQNIKTFQPKYWNLMQDQTQTSLRMMNVRKQQFKRFEISVEKISFNIMSFCFQFWMLLLLALKRYYPKCNNVNDAKVLQFFCHYGNIVLRLEVANHKY